MYPDIGPDLYYTFQSQSEEFFLDYNRYGRSANDLSSTFDTMVMDGLHFAR